MMKRFLIGILAITFSVVVISTSSPLTARGEGGYSIAGANAYVQAKDWNGLLAYSQAWTKAQPNDPMGWYYLGVTYGSKLNGVGLQRPNDALPAFQRAVALKPQWPEAWYALGMTAQELGRFDESIEAFNHAVEQAPTRTNYWNSLATSYSHVRKPQLAAQALDNLEKNAKTYYDWYILGNGLYALGAAYGDFKAFQKAEAAYKGELQLNPQEGHIWTNLGTAEEVLGNVRGAFEAYQKGGQLGDPKGTSNYQRLAGDLQFCRNYGADIDKRGRLPEGVSRRDVVNYNQHCSKFFGQGYGIFQPPK